ncbi:uncharacterized protein IUM83_14481 [Phytophthora cinnamomi]|uniref:uncharacterized protein n=1 Tax=Phytophthora cinnamomi TaxID=4785 RepID=UPI0035597272|nr:hypothetical protein IUM83_14481 [Phytophthora cinnamomi]
MTQVAPSTAPSDVTVVIYAPKDDKQQLLDRSSADKTPTRHKVVQGIVYALLAFAFVCGLVAATAFFGDWFTLLLVLTRSM